MRKFLTAAVAALTLAGGGLATAQPAAAAPWHGGGYGWHGGHGYGGGALAAGILGLAVGAAIASPHYGYGPDYAYGPGYGYGPGPYAYGTCYARQRVWDPYVGGYVARNVPYAC